MGRVYLAQQPANAAKVALKLPHQEFTTKDHALDKFMRMGEFLSEVDHPNIAKVLDTGRLNSGRAFVAMELLEGKDLGELLSESKGLDYGQVIRISQQICSALQAVHQAGLVHQDLKPNNIFLLSINGAVKLLDFGAARISTTPELAQNNISCDGLPLGTPEYWSPEQARGQKTDQRSDLYSVGVVMYEALSGHTPFSSHSYSDVISQHVRCEPALLEHAPNKPPIPEELKGIVLRCLKKDPNQRFQSAQQLRAALDTVPIAQQSFQLSGQLQGADGTPQAVTALSGRMRPLIIGGLALALLSGGFFLGALASKYGHWPW